MVIQMRLFISLAKILIFTVCLNLALLSIHFLELWSKRHDNAYATMSCASFGLLCLAVTTWRFLLAPRLKTIVQVYSSACERWKIAAKECRNVQITQSLALGLLNIFLTFGIVYCLDVLWFSPVGILIDQMCGHGAVQSTWCICNATSKLFETIVCPSVGLLFLLGALASFLKKRALHELANS